MTQLWLWVGDATAIGHELAVSALLRRRFAHVAEYSHELMVSKRPRSQSGVVPPHSIEQARSPPSRPRGAVSNIPSLPNAGQSPSGW